MTYDCQSYPLLQTPFLIFNKSVHTYSLLSILFPLLNKHKKTGLIAHAQAYHPEFSNATTNCFFKCYKEDSFYPLPALHSLLP